MDIRHAYRQNAIPDCAIVRRDLLSRVGGFVERVSIHEDVNLMMRLADQARCILYRPECVVSYRLPEADSITSRTLPLEEALDAIVSAQHARATCNDARIRRCARFRESWTMREVAKRLIEERQPATALPFTWQALCVYPTLGAAALFGSTLFRALTGKIFHRKER